MSNRISRAFPTAGVPTGFWPAMAEAVERMLATGPRALAVRGEGSAVAFSSAEVADLNMAFAWADALALDSLVGRTEDFVLVAAPEGNEAVAARAAELGIVAVPEPLPVWLGDIDPGTLPPPRWPVRRARPADMPAVRGVLAEAFGLPVEPLDTAFPDAVTDGIDVHLAEVDGAAAAAVMAIRSGDLVSLWSGGTRPALRSAGLFTDLLAQVLRTEFALGARSFAGITEAVASGRALQRLGARRVTDGHVWLRGASVGELLSS